jgi:hypothetical protein
MRLLGFPAFITGRGAASCAGTIALALVLAMSGLGTAGATSPPLPSANPLRTSSTLNLLLSAVLAPGQEPITEGLAWRIAAGTPGVLDDSAVVWRGADARPELSLRAGTYTVEVRHGLAQVSERVEVSAHQPTTAQISLGAGILNLSSSVEPGGQSLERIFYEVRQDGSPEALVRSSQPSPSFILPAGTYQINARLGVAQANDEVVISPGAVVGRGLALGAAKLRLKTVLANGDPAPDGVFYHIYGEDGAEVLRSALPDPELILPPGAYRVVAQLGAARTELGVRLSGGQALEEVLILPAGELRLETRLSGRDAPIETEVSYLITPVDAAATPEDAGVLRSAQADWKLYLEAGRYRVQSAYGQGNAIVEQLVTVEPGSSQKLTLTHEVGRAQLGLVRVAGGLTLGRVQWTIRDAEGKQVASSREAVPELDLRAGQYVALAEHDNKVERAAFTIVPNQTTVVEIVAK